MTTMTDYAHGQFSWVDLMSANMDESKVFYAALFGWEAVDQDTQGGPPYVLFQLDGKRVAGMGQLPDDLAAQGVPPVWNSYVNVDDLAATVARVTELGGMVMMPPMQVLNHGHMAGVQGPEGAPLFLWQKLDHFGAEAVNEPNTLCWNELATREVEQSRAFFESLFGWQCELQEGTPGTYYVAKLGETQNAGLMQMTEEWGDMPCCWGTYFAVDDVDAQVAKVTELGGRVNVPAFDMSVGRMAVVADAHGAVFSMIRLDM